jgi:hypothetical protein
MSKPVSVRHYNDPLHGVVTVVEHEHGMFATNAKPNPHGKWVKKDNNTYRWEPTPNRAARRNRKLGAKI